jgi:hypothetical protein
MTIDKDHQQLKPTNEDLLTNMAMKDQLITNTRNSTTSFLNTATLVFLIGAGITAAAGTRLALQLLIDNLFTVFPFRLSIYRRITSLFLFTTSSF